MKTRSTWLGALLLGAAFACMAQMPPRAGWDQRATAGERLEPVPPGEGAMTADEAARLRAAEQAGERYYARIAAELAATGRPRELAFAATLLQLADAAPATAVVPGGNAPLQASPRDPRVAQWRRLASARAGADVVANALLMQGAGAADADADTRRQAIERWRQREPDNLAPELLGNAPAGDWLPQAGSYRRFDWHYYELLRWMQSVLAAHPPVAAERAGQGDDELPPEQAAAITAVGIQMAVAMPGVSPLLAACRGKALDSAPTRRGDCRRAGQVMADDSDTRLGTAVGIALLRRTAGTAAERDDALARQRRNDWQMFQWGRFAGAGPDAAAGQFTRMLLDPSIRSEQDVATRALTEAGVPLDPPAGWRSPWPHADDGG